MQRHVETSSLGLQRKGVLGSLLYLILTGDKVEQGAPGSFAVGLWEKLLILLQLCFSTLLSAALLPGLVELAPDRPWVQLMDALRSRGGTQSLDVLLDSGSPSKAERHLAWVWLQSCSSSMSTCFCGRLSQKPLQGFPLKPHMLLGSVLQP